MVFGRDPFAGWEERARINSTLRMCNDFIDLVKSAEKKHKETIEGLKVIIDDWLEKVGAKLIIILEQMKEHLHTWVSVKIGGIDGELSLFINNYFDHEINAVREGVLFNNIEERDTVIRNLENVKKKPNSTDDNIRAVIMAWQNSIADRTINLLRDCKEDIYAQVKTNISVRESSYIDDFFDLGIKIFKDGVNYANVR